MSGLETGSVVNVSTDADHSHVVSVFETVLSEVLFGVSEARRQASRPSLDRAG